MSDSVTVGVCQLQSMVGTADMDPREHNLARLSEAASRVAAQGADVIAFGECFLTGYRSDEHHRKYAVRLSPPDQYLRELEALSAKLGTHLVVGAGTTPSDDSSALYNSALVIGPTGLVGVYHKVHLAHIVIGGEREFDETAFFSPGGSIETFDTPHASLGVQICRDNRYPEVSRIQALRGAQVIVNVTAPDPAFMSFWEASTYVRALENQVWYVMAAVVGAQRDDDYAGGSRIISPTGEVVAQAPLNREADLVHTITLNEITTARQHGRVLEQRVPSTYGAIVEPVRS
jgi:predicted amidohydrolase